MSSESKRRVDGSLQVLAWKSKSSAILCILANLFPLGTGCKSRLAWAYLDKVSGETVFSSM